MSDSTQKRLKQLLDYIQHMVRLPERATLSLREYGRFVYLQENLEKRAGIEFDTNDSRGPIWLRIQRLQKTPAPEPKENLKPWVSRYKNPFREPVLEDSRVEQMTKKEARALVKEAKIAPEDMSATQKPGEDQVEVTFRRTKNPSIRRSFKAYLDNHWLPWAESERPVRETIKLYHDFFTLHQSCSVQAVEQPLEVVWGLGVAIWKTSAGLLRHPLIEALVEVDIDPVSHSIQVRPRETEARVYLKPFMAIDNPGVPALQEEARKHFDGLASGPEGNEFCPFDRSTFEPLLKMAASLLSSSAQYTTHDGDATGTLTLPSASEHLAITDTWALYARPRSDNLFVDDLERLRKAVDECEDLMSVSAATKLAETPSAELAYTPRLVKLAGVEAPGETTPEVAEVSSDSPEEEPELFFPKEFNQAQVRVIDQLEQADGVVLQGPPGTGKTHTIANIICHYLATGRRVLVTSQGEPALKVLRDFIPEDIRHLTISLLTKDHEGLEQLETAVTLLANEVSRIDPSTIETQILEKETQLKQLRQQIRGNESSVRDAAARQLRPIDEPELGMDGVTPTDAASLLLNESADEEDWLDAEIALSEHSEALTPKHVEAVRKARQRLGENLRYLQLELPDLSLVPAAEQIVEIHDEMVRVAGSAEAGVGDSLDLSAPNVRTRAEDLLKDLRRLQEIHQGMAGNSMDAEALPSLDHPWPRSHWTRSDR